MDSLKSESLGNLVRVLPKTLKHLDLEHSTSLGCLPNLAELPRLETLILMGCKVLHTVPDVGWGELPRVKKIDLFGCNLLKDDDVAAIVHGLTPEQYQQIMLIMPDGKLHDRNSPLM